MKPAFYGAEESQEASALTKTRWSETLRRTEATLSTDCGGGGGGDFQAA